MQYNGTTYKNFFPVYHVRSDRFCNSLNTKNLRKTCVEVLEKTKRVVKRIYRGERKPKCSSTWKISFPLPTQIIYVYYYTAYVKL
jgi:hypothetical protein